MQYQRAFKLSIPGTGLPSYVHRLQNRELNKPTQHVSEEKLFADLLKRQARRVMQDVTECHAATLPANLARLDDLRELFRHVLAHQYKETPESVVTGR